MVLNEHYGSVINCSESQETMMMTFCIPNRRACPRNLSMSAVLALGAAALIHSPSACADTPTQAIQAVCDRAAESYGRQDLAGFIAMYSPGYIVKSVEGHKANFRQVQSGMGIIFAKNGGKTTAHCTVSRVVVQGDQARAVMQWRYVILHSRSASAPAYTIIRGYEASSIWKKLAGGWKETSADVTHNFLDYRR